MTETAASRRANSEIRRSNLQRAAISTADRVGMVLRLHLATEVLLDDHLNLEAQGPLGSYLTGAKYFGGKLSLSVALGLPLPLANVCKHLNQMRNSIAHPRSADATVTVEDVLKFAEVVNGLEPLEGFRLLGDKSGGPPQSEYRGKGDLLDLAAAYFAFDNTFEAWLDNHRRVLGIQ